MITRRAISLACGTCVLVAHRLGRPQAVAKMRRVGYLAVSSKAAGERVLAAFRQGMNDLGWLEGKNVEYRFVYADSQVERLDALVGELLALKVDVIVVGNATAARAVQRATQTVPIVIVSVSNPVGLGLVASLAKPGGNITGITSQFEDVLGKLIEILHEVTPLSQRVAILLSESSPLHGAYWARAQSACNALGLVALRVTASTPAQFGPAVEQIVRERSQAIVVVPDPVYFGERARLHELLQPTRLPVAYVWREHVAAGGLLSYSTDQVTEFRYVAKFVDKILKGAKPADLPVEQPTKFDLVINLKTAKELDIKVPQAVLLRADEVIQ